jgi:hypothetical protein
MPPIVEFVDEPLSRDVINELVHAYAFMPWMWMYNGPKRREALYFRGWICGATVEVDSLVSTQTSLGLPTEVEKPGARWTSSQIRLGKCIKDVHVVRMNQAKGNRIVDWGCFWN